MRIFSILAAFMVFFGGLAVHANIVGGVTRIQDLDDEGLIDASNQLVLSLNAMSNSSNILKLTHVIDATKQVVSGIKYNIVADTGYTNCMKSDFPDDLSTADLSSCELNSSLGHVRVTGTVISAPWRSPAYEVEVTKVEQH